MPSTAGPLLCFASRWTFINHGAFGGALRCATLEAEAWRRRCEAQPLLFLDRWAGVGAAVLRSTRQQVPAYHEFPIACVRFAVYLHALRAGVAGSCSPSWCG